MMSGSALLVDKRLVVAIFIFGLLLGATLGVVYGRYSTPYGQTTAPSYDVYFSPKGGCAEAVIYWIGRANQSVHVLMYIFSLDSIADALVSAHNRGVEVRVVLDKSQSYSRYGVLKAAGIEVRNDTNWEGILHDKIAIIERAIKSKSTLRIVYLKPNDEKTKRDIVPKYVGEMEYNNVEYIGVQAFCLKRNGDRVFRVDRILEVEEL